MNTDKFLPIGSIVKVNTIPNDVMIIGYMIELNTEKGKIVRDYMGCNALTGFDSNQAIFFNKDDINNIIFMGYKNIDTIEKLKVLDIVHKELKNSSSIEEAEGKIIIDSLNKKTNSDIASQTRNLTNKFIIEGEKK